jgi:small subunit ribosomal protein S17
MVEIRNIGINVPIPKESCNDPLCPFHGKISIRGRLLEGIVLKNRAERTIVVRREYLHYIPKYKRYEKRRKNISAHCPPCISVKEGDKVTIAECRPISKTVSFVVIEKKEGK